MVTQKDNSDNQFGNYCISSEDNTLLHNAAILNVLGYFWGQFLSQYLIIATQKDKADNVHQKTGRKVWKANFSFILFALNYGVLQGTCRPAMDCLSSSPFCHHCLTSDNPWMTSFPQDFPQEFFPQDMQDKYIKTSRLQDHYLRYQFVKHCKNVRPVPCVAMSSSTLCLLYSIYNILLN